MLGMPLLLTSFNNMAQNMLTGEAQLSSQLTDNRIHANDFEEIFENGKITTKFAKQSFKFQKDRLKLMLNHQNTTGKIGSEGEANGL